MKTKLDEETDRLEYQLAELKARIAAQRRSRAPEEVKDYAFRDARGSVSLSELFGERAELILVHNMGISCNYCTMWADGFSGLVPHLEDRAAFAVVSADPPEVQTRAIAERGWKFRMVSIADEDFAHDMGFMHPEEGLMPGVLSFVRGEDGRVLWTGRAEFGPGDDYCATWHLFDLLPKGPDGWEPKKRYR